MKLSRGVLTPVIFEIYGWLSVRSRTHIYHARVSLHLAAIETSKQNVNPNFSCVAKVEMFFVLLRVSLTIDNGIVDTRTNNWGTTEMSSCLMLHFLHVPALSKVGITATCSGNQTQGRHGRRARVVVEKRVVTSWMGFVPSSIGT